VANRRSVKTRSQGGKGRNPAVTATRRGPSLWTILAIVVVVVFAAGVFFYAENKNTQASTPPPGVQHFDNLSRNHVNNPVQYPQNPPVGGDHNPIWLNCGIYSSPVPSENAVHSMEHGSVWITYQPNLPANEVSALQKLVGKNTYVILSPYPGLPAPIVASAWGVQAKYTSASDPNLAQFMHYYRQGPQTPEQGASCTGGTGTPQQ
jgi:hypothetical protein